MPRSKERKRVTEGEGDETTSEPNVEPEANEQEPNADQRESPLPPPPPILEPPTDLEADQTPFEFQSTPEDVEEVYFFQIWSQMNDSFRKFSR